MSERPSNDETFVPEFLVRIDIEIPAELPQERARELTRREAERARELAATGTLVRLWRVPGRRANVGLWRASDATQLHEDLATLPMYPYMRIAVEPLARHPSDPQP
jgi:muconolactone D-isomerase